MSVSHKNDAKIWVSELTDNNVRFYNRKTSTLDLKNIMTVYFSKRPSKQQKKAISDIPSVNFGF